MSRWPMVPLGTILTKSEEWISIDPERQYQEVTVRLWGKGVVQRRMVLGAEIASSSRLVVHPRQFVISRIDARNGASGLVPDELEGAVVSNDFPVFTPRPDRLLSEFLGWYGKTGEFVDLCRAASEGTTNRVRLKEDRFLATMIPLPPLSEQRRLVARIEGLVGRLSEARALRQEAIQVARSLVTSLHLKMAAGDVRRLGEMLVLDEDRVEVTAGRFYPQIGVKGFGGGLFARETLESNQTTYKNFNRLYEGAIVLSQVKGWEGAIAVCPPSFAGRYVSPEYRTFRCVDGRLSPEYFSALVETPWFWARLRHLTRGVGARRERIRPEHFLAMKLPMPSPRDQTEARRVFEKLRLALPFQKKTKAELDAFEASVLRQAFTGTS